MADEADSKSVVGNHVRVQVPLPAVYEDAINVAETPCLSHFFVFGCATKCSEKVFTLFYTIPLD